MQYAGAPFPVASLSSLLREPPCLVYVVTSIKPHFSIVVIRQQASEVDVQGLLCISEVMTVTLHCSCIVAAVLCDVLVRNCYL